MLTRKTKDRGKLSLNVRSLSLWRKLLRWRQRLLWIKLLPWKLSLWKTSILVTVPLFSLVMLLYLVKDLSIGEPTFRQEHRRPIELNAEANLANSTSREFNKSLFIIELDDNQPRQFNSSILNFSFTASLVNVTKYQDYYLYDLRNFKLQQRMDWKGYITVDMVGGELSQCTKQLLLLVFLAGPRKVVAPRMAKGLMSSRTRGAPFGEFYDVPHLNLMLSHYPGYSEIATEEEYQEACKDHPKTIVNILYDETPLQKTVNASYPDIYNRVLKDGWAECRVTTNYLPKRIPIDNNTRVYCVNPSILRNMMSLLEQNVLKDRKCIRIPHWKNAPRSIYDNLTTVLHSKGIPDPSRLLQWLIKPSVTVMEEVRAFQELRLEKPYVGIHIRGVKFKNKAYMPRCFKIALEMVRALRLTRNVKSLFLSTDMSKFGGITNHDKTSHQAFAQQSGAVIYDPNVTKKLKVIDNWTVSLTEVMLLSQSDHLIAIGHGSFSSFISNRFIIQHLDKDATTWSLTKTCFWSGMVRDITNKP